MSADQTKTITLVSNNWDVEMARQKIAMRADERHVQVLAIEEQPSRMTTKLVVTVGGHPKRIREFHDDLRDSGGGGGSVADQILGRVLTDGWRAATRRWQGRHDPPLPDDPDHRTS